MARGRGIDGSALTYLKQRHGADSVEYQSALRGAIEDMKILSPRQGILQTEEVFEDATGKRRSVSDIAHALGGRRVEVSDGRVIDQNWKNAAPMRSQLRGAYEAELGGNISVHEAGQTPMRAKDVSKWGGDSVYDAYLFPDEVDVKTASDAEMRAARMGAAASRGDRAGVSAAQKRYDFTPEEAREFQNMTRIGGQKFATAIKDQGLDPTRAGDTIVDASGRTLSQLSPPEQKQWFQERADDLTRTWLQGGGTGFLDARSDIAIPGNPYQMEHDTAWSKSNPSGLAETGDNRVGFYERYLNSEKADIDPTTYYQMQRLHRAADREGVPLNGVVIQDGIGALDSILERDNPTVTQTGERLIKDRTDIHHPDRVEMNKKLKDIAIAPSTFGGDVYIKESGPGSVYVSV